MAKFSGIVGFARSEKLEYGVVKEVITEKKYFGDISRMAKRNLESEKVNDDMVMNNSISIVANAFAMQNYFAIRFVIVAGVCWSVSSVTVAHPRLVLEIGDVYNGPRAEA